MKRANLIIIFFYMTVKAELILLHSIIAVSFNPVIDTIGSQWNVIAIFCSFILFHNLCMSQIQGCPCPPPGIWHLKFFLVKFPTMRAVSLVKCPPPYGFFRGQMPWPPGWSDKSGNLSEVFNTAISIIFCIPVQSLRSSFCFLCT